jgi:4-cresol dehydrogenase (hydroxylating)
LDNADKCEKSWTMIEERDDKFGTAMTDFEKAIGLWQSCLGTAHVSVEASEILSIASFATTQRARAILSPASTFEVQECLKIATQLKLPIYPISRGRNCGYGSRVPYQDGSVILDLHRMDRIISYDEELATVTLEPGVTQKALEDFLRKHGAKHCLDPIASFPDCSVIGNILERGHGMSAHADRIASSCDYEVVLATGARVQTGYSALPGARAAGLDRWAPGANLDGLFSQSSFGVVTKMTVWLMPRPELVRALTFRLNSNDDLGRSIDLLRPLRLDGTLRFGPRYFNEYRLLQTYSSFPWREMKGITPLSPEILAIKMRELDIPDWAGLIGFHGSPARVRADEELTRETLRPLDIEISVVDDASASFRNVLPEGLSEQDRLAPPKTDSAFERFSASAFELMRGRTAPLPQRPRWRKRGAQSEKSGDWSNDRCGLIWCPVTSPLRGADVTIAVEIYRRIVGSFGFEPDMSVSSIRDRTVELNASLVFDRDDEPSEQAALECALKLLEKLGESGFYPHRLGLATMSVLRGLSPEREEVLRTLKVALDPAQILAIGRY